MTTEEENELLTRVGPGMPGGEMLRRYWQPAALADELPVGGPPLSIRLLGEDLVLFRDQTGRPGLLGIHCSHRGADLSYGRIEDGGIRCIYHGWLYDVHGRCLEQPGEPAGQAGLATERGKPSADPLMGAVPARAFHQEIQHRAYPCREMGGLILTYMGPGEPPEVPAYPFLIAPDECRANSKLFSECNYLQANEGNIDSVHLSFLHMGDPVNRSNNHGYDLIEPIETDYGLRIFFVHQGPDADRLHIRHFVLPNLSPGGTSPGGRPDTVNWHVPIDDTHHWKYWITASSEPIERRSALDGRAELTPDYRLVRNKANRYLQDREEMKAETWSGLGPVFQPHDTCVTEGAGPIQNRTQEHLAYSDRGIMTARRQLLTAIKDVQDGRDPRHVIRDPETNDFSHMWGGGNWLVPKSFDWRHCTLDEMMAAALPSGERPQRRQR